MAFSFIFTVTDLTAFFALYFLMALFLDGFGVADAVKSGAYSTIGRFIYLQVFAEFLFLVLLCQFSLQRSIVFILIANFLALFLPLIVLAGKLNILPYFSFLPVKWGLAPGWALLVSTLVSWLLLFRVSRNFDRSSP